MLLFVLHFFPHLNNTEKTSFAGHHTTHICKGADVLRSRYVGWYNMELQYPRYHCITPMFLLVDNSDSPSIVQQSQQGCGSSCNSLLTVIPSSVMYPMPYACQLAFSNVGMSCSVPNGCSLFCVYVCVCLPGSSLDSPTGFHYPFYPGCSLFAPWDSLSDYVHPGIACLAFWASEWAGAFWVWFVIGYLC